MSLPDFLIIGAMKSGTTTLYRDLLTNPRIFMSTPKEPHTLLTEEVFTPTGRAAYEALFAGAGADQLKGEASTGYTKLPDHPGVPARAHRLLGNGLRVIYIVRDPVSRAVSHHTHANASGVDPCRDVNESVRTRPEYVNWGLYAMQARPWLEALGPERVRIVEFGAFTKDRRGFATSLAEFLGIPAHPELVRTDEVFNKSEGKAVGKGVWGRFRKTGLYRGIIRRALPIGLRDRLRDTLLPTAPPPPAPPSRDTVDWLIDRFARDAEELGGLMGVGGCPWDWEKVRKKFESARTGAGQVQAGVKAADNAE